MNDYFHLALSRFCLNRFVDNKCPLTCKTCPEFVFSALSRVVKLDRPASAFSSHNYDQEEELPPPAVASSASTNLHGDASEPACQDIFDSCDQLKAHGECENPANHQ